MRRSREGIEILIAEDSPTQARRMASILEQAGYTATIADDGQKALDMAQHRAPALVISDVVMPVLDGYGLCCALKADPALRHVPVVLVTTLADPDDVLRGLECGADNFIRKPVDEHYLLSRVEYLLMNKELRAHQGMRLGLEIDLRGRRYAIGAERQQILDLLISTYEQAVDINKDLVQRERDLADSYEVLDILYRIAECLNRSVLEEDAVGAVLDEVMELAGVAGAWVCIDGDDGDSRMIGKAGAVGADAPQPHVSVALAMPKSGRTGTLCIAAFESDGITEAQRHTLEGVGNQLATALERIHLFLHMEKLVEQRSAELRAEVEERRRQEAHVIRLNRLYDVLSGINTTIVRVTARDELFAEACRIAVERGNFAWARIVMDAETTTVGRDAPPPPQLIDDALRTGAPAFATEGDESMVALPLRQQGEVRGALVLGALEAIDADEMRLLDEIAGDISFALDHIEQETRLHTLAYFDEVTGLPNRSLYAERLTLALQHAERTGRPVAAAILDIHRFKAINDSLGHHIGDRFLRAIGERLTAAVGAQDTVARVASDEFAMIFADIESAADAERLVSALLRSFATPVVVDTHELFLRASVGVAVYPSDGTDAMELNRNATAALHEAKESGQHGVRAYSAEITARAHQRLALETDLRRALQRKEFVLHFQPIVELEPRRVVGVEALVRWQSPERGFVSPAEFIPVAEETGLIVELGAWVLQDACTTLVGWGEPAADVRVSVNVSVRQFLHGSLVKTVESALAASGLAADRLTLEITESHLMTDLEDVVPIMRTLQARGVRFSIDDFGTGYSSLSYLKHLPIADLKIDRSFVNNVTENGDDASIAEAIISMAHSLKLRVVAEGVETGEQYDFLRERGCDSAQGYLISRPLPAEKLLETLRTPEPAG